MDTYSPAHAHMLQQLAGQNYFDFSFDDGYFAELARLMHVPEGTSLFDFADDHFEIVSAYFQYLRFEENWVTNEDENHAIQTAKDHIIALIPSLNELGFSENIRSRVFHELSAGNGSAFEVNGLRLSDLTGDEHGLVFENITSLLRDLCLHLNIAKSEPSIPIQKSKALSTFD